MTRSELFSLLLGELAYYMKRYYYSFDLNDETSDKLISDKLNTFIQKWNDADIGEE